MARAESSTPASASTAAQILDAAERLVQERGFNGGSATRTSRPSSA